MKHCMLLKICLVILSVFDYKLSCVNPAKWQINVTSCIPVTQIVENHTIWWGNYASTSKWYASKPVCLGENLEILKRYCAINTWYVEPQCSQLHYDINPCPEDFFYYEESEICYATIENQTFPPICPYPNVMSFFDYKIILEEGLVDGPIWVPAKSESDYGIGNMIITEPTEYYGNIMRNHQYWRNSFNKNCLIYTPPWNFEAVYCNSSYKALCAYYPLKKSKNNYCSVNQTAACIMSDFDLEMSKCLCVQNNEENNTCENLAELKRPYQNFLDFNNTKCRIGLENNDGKFIWSTSKEEIAYSNWSIETNFSHKYGALHNGMGWTLEYEPVSSCVICEKEIEFHKPRLDLTLDRDNKMLILTIDNIKDLVITGANQYPIFCFSDTSTVTQMQRFSKNYSAKLTETDKNRAALHFKYSTSCPGHYWCEAFKYPDFSLIRTKKILVLDDDLYGNEFATTLLLEYTTDDNPSILSFFNSISTDIDNELQSQYDEVPFYLRWMTTLAVDEEDMTVEYLVHVTSKTFNRLEVEYKEFKETLLSAVEEVPSILMMTDFYSVQFCMPISSISNGMWLNWPLTKISATVTPLELCLQHDGSPVTRTCYGDFLSGARWSEVNGTCSHNPVKSPVTQYLYDLMNNGNVSLPTVLGHLLDISEHSPEFLAIDVHFIAKILENMDKKYVTDLTEITKTVNNILNAQRSTLSSSQLLLNATDKILYSFDILLESFYKTKHLRSQNFVSIATDNLMVFIFDVRSIIARGVALCTINGKTEVIVLEKGISQETLLKTPDLEVATYIPEDLVQQINESLPLEEPFMIAVSIFLNDCLFNEHENETRSSNSRIFGILLPKTKSKFTTAIPVIFKPLYVNYERNCAYWHYGSASHYENFKGRWETESEPFQPNETNLEFCGFTHTTHFALLLLGDLSEPEQETLIENQTVLYIITTIGCSLSLFGILVIFLTFFLFKRWRGNKGNQILVQFGIVTVLQICLLYTSSQIGNQVNKGWCVLIGALLHFAVLSQFCWMLVMAILQYRRFVLVFSKPCKYLIFKACVFGYLLPLIPVVIYVTLFNENYVVGQTGMCYPTGEGLYVGVLIPGGCIIIANLVIFCIIIWNIFYRKLDSDYTPDYVLTLRLRLVFVLFFILGITWIFGYLAEIFHMITFIYLFCITASVQGFILFLAFILFNESTRKLYVGILKVLERKIRY